MSNRKVVVNVKTLYFEGAGWEKAERSINTIGNCRVRTAFHLDNGKGVYLEIVYGEMLGERKKLYGGLQYVGFVDFLFYITDEVPNDDCNKHKLPDMRNTHFAYDFDSILAFVNSLGASFDNICVLPNLAGYRVHSDDRKSDTTMLMSLRQTGKLLGEQKKFTSTSISWSNPKARNFLTSLCTMTKATRQSFT